MRRFLTVSKYELKQYSGSIADEAVVLLIVLSSFLLIMIPEVKEASLPSAYHIYSVGYLDGSLLSNFESYYFVMVPFRDGYEMMQANSMQQIDAFTSLSRGGKVAVFGSGTLKGNAALSRLNELMMSINENLIYSMVEENSRLGGVLLPLRLTLLEEEIDYSSVINASISLRRREMFNSNRLRPGAGESIPPVFEPGELDMNLTGRAAGESAGAGENADSGMLQFDSVLPSQIEVGLPFKNLYRNMMLLSASIMMSIILALSLARERIDRNLENLFAAPLSRFEILLGKSLPYLGIMVFFSLFYGFLLSSGLNALKIAYVFTVISVTLLSFSFFSVIVSRSYRELTFVGSFGMFAFFFFIVLPNVFSGINVLAFISPLDIITTIENDAFVPTYELLLAMTPYNFLALFFLVFTGVCFEAEVMFSNMSVGEIFRAFYTNLYRRLSNNLTYAAVSVSLLVPFIFILESIAAYLILPMGFIAPLASILLLAAIEEFAKILPYVHNRMNPVTYGVVAGLSFFLSEKLFNIYLITKVYSFLGGAYAIFVVKGLFMTLGVHIASTSLLAFILSRERSRLSYVGGFVLAVLLHLVYNVAVIRGLL